MSKDQVTKRCAATHRIELGPNQIEFDIELPRGSGVCGVFFTTEANPLISSLGGKRGGRVIPHIVVDCDPDAEVVLYHFAFVPLDTIAGVNPGHSWKIIGSYPTPTGMGLALYNIFSTEV